MSRIILSETAVPSAPSAGKVTMFVDVADGVLKQINELGVVAGVGLAYRQVAKSLGASTTTDTSADGVEKLTMTVSNLVLGNYELVWSYAWSHDSTTGDFVARIQQDNTGGSLQTSFSNLMDHKQEPSDSDGTGFGNTDQMLRASGVIDLQTFSGSHQFDLDFGSRGGGLSSIADVRFVFQRVA